MASHADFEAVIGLEVHAQLLTKTKAFCGCRTSFGDAPNHHVCPVCLGMPGALPTLSSAVVELAARAGLALGCTIAEKSVFSRKSYFYPDMPKGYQITQYEQPICLGGQLEVETANERRTVRIRRIHIEEDAGKSVHSGAAGSVVDLNRAGTPLIEIVSEPDLRSAAEAGQYLRRLREILMFAHVNDGNLERGNFRCDANVSVRERGSQELGTRTELKNINSFRFVEEAIESEIKRHVGEVLSGRAIKQQTRGYNSETRTTYVLRDKENDSGYRYFPEPDLRPLRLSASAVEEVRRRLPELPEPKRARYVGALGLSKPSASVLASHPGLARFFEETLQLFADPIKVANFIQAEILRDTDLHGTLAKLPISPGQLAELLQLAQDGVISGKQAKEVFSIISGTERSPREVVESSKMAMSSDTGMIESIARKLVEANARQAAQYRSGKTALLGFFVGQLMKETKGSANPELASDILKRILGEGATS